MHSQKRIVQRMEFKPGTQEKSINNATVLMMASRGAFFRDVTGEVTSPGHFANEAEN
jgi:hypothetical protein